MAQSLSPSSVEPPPGFISPLIERHRHFFANLVPSRADGLLVACGGWEQCSPDYLVQRENFPFHALEFVCQGRGELTVDGRTEPLFPGSIFSYGPEMAHRIRSEPREPMVKYFVDFSGNAAETLAPGLQQAGVIQVSRIDVVQEWFEQLLAAGEQAGPGSGRICALITELIIRHTLANPFRSQSGAGSSSMAVHQRCHAALCRDFLTLKSAAELAQACHIDIAYMTRLFQRHGNESPYQMLVRLKMNHAAELLVTSDRTLREIGEDVGIHDPFHFSRVFKRHFGLAPKAFRQGYHRRMTGGAGNAALHI